MFSKSYPSQQYNRRYMKSFLVVALAFLCSSLLVEAALDSEAYYYLSTEFQGSRKVLDVVNDGTNNQVALAKKGSFSGQFWKLTSLGDGYYRLTTKWRGDDWSLDVVNDGKLNNRLQLAKSGDFSGQKWMITQEKEGYFRLTTLWRGTAFSLDIVNEGKNSKSLILAPSGDFSGQMWKIEESATK